MLAACVILARVLLAAAVPAIAADPAPRLSLSATEWNFGEVWEGDRVRGSFTIRNDGDAPLRIKGIRTSCTCTTTELVKDRLAPGESVDVTILLNSKKRQGPIATTVVIESNDPSAAPAKVEVRGMVKKLFEFKSLDPQTGEGSTSRPSGGPRVIARPGSGSDFPARRQGGDGHAIPFGRMCVTQARSRKLEIVSQFDQPAKLEISDAPKHLDVELSPREEGRVYELRVATRPPMKPGPINELIVIKTGLEKNPDLEFLIAGEVLEPISSSPANIRVPAKIAKPISRPATITYSTAESFKIGALRVVGCDKAAAEFVTPATQPAVGADGFAEIAVRVLFSAGAEIPDDGAALEIETGNPKLPMLTIPIRSSGKRAADVGAQPTSSPSSSATTKRAAAVSP